MLENLEGDGKFMRSERIVTLVVVGFLLASPVWGEPANWAIWVPTHASYTHSEFGSFGTFHGDYDLAGIDHISWFKCWWGHLCTEDRTAFQFYEIRGDYYDCEGNLLETDRVYYARKWVVLRETGTVFSPR